MSHKRKSEIEWSIKHGSLILRMMVRLGKMTIKEIEYGSDGHSAF